MVTWEHNITGTQCEVKNRFVTMICNFFLNREFCKIEYLIFILYLNQNNLLSYSQGLFIGTCAYYVQYTVMFIICLLLPYL